MLPPLEEHRVADELEPRRELERRVLELLLELLGRDVLRVPDLVGVDVQVDVRLDEQDVVDYASRLASSTQAGAPTQKHSDRTQQVPDLCAGGRTSRRRDKTCSRARPICRRWAPCSGCA